jgi:hypothetical protein
MSRRTNAGNMKRPELSRRRTTTNYKHHHLPSTTHPRMLVLVIIEDVESLVLTPAGEEEEEKKMGAQLIITRGDSAVSFLISARILLLSSALLCPSFVCVQSHRNHRHVLLLRRTHARVCLCNRCVCVCMFFRATGLVFFPTFVGTHQTQLFLFCFLNAKEFAACAAAACVIGNSWVKYFTTTTTTTSSSRR